MTSPKKTSPLNQPAPLLAAAIHLAGKGVYGMIWLDDDLIVAARYGHLANFAEIGEPIEQSCAVLSGYDKDILALRTNPEKVINLPSVSLIDAKSETPRLNLSVFWSPDIEQFLVVVARAISDSAPQVELSRQMRARLIAEEEISAKSRELARINSELALANRDLEDYAAVISHDLQAPLRAMRYLADDVDLELGEDRTSAMRKKLDALRTQSLRMTQMLNALLDYASLGRKSDVVDRTDTRKLIEEIVASTDKPQGMQIELTGDWPEIETAAAPLDLVLRNLIDNAIKHRDQSTGLIVVHADPASEPLANGGTHTPKGTLRITISDDGPGIDPHHHDAALLPFRTLATHDDNTNRGMGLAFVKRTLETIGGSLSLESDPKHRRGCRFQIDWPLTIAQPPDASDS